MLHKDVLVRLCEARERLMAGCAEPLAIGRAARESGFSTFHFIRLFRAVFGETPRQCCIRARLALACEMLITTEHSVTRICMAVGYSSVGSFTELFTQRIGMTPSRYRRRMQAKAPGRGLMPPELVPGCFSLMGAPR